MLQILHYCDNWNGLSYYIARVPVGIFSPAICCYEAPENLYLCLPVASLKLRLPLALGQSNPFLHEQPDTSYGAGDLVGNGGSSLSIQKFCHSGWLAPLELVVVPALRSTRIRVDDFGRAATLSLDLALAYRSGIGHGLGSRLGSPDSNEETLLPNAATGLEELCSGRARTTAFSLGSQNLSPLCSLGMGSDSQSH